ncbi:CHAT domain-containing protein [Nonomuraea sp. NPDC048882]|uniref:CHAT domain-containing protein n=1 Tax=Nonomuraea sp. NPDC048882 TaxID=3154347 RepID=UPI0033CDBC32
MPLRRSHPGEPWMPHAIKARRRVLVGRADDAEREYRKAMRLADGRAGPETQAAIRQNLALLLHRLGRSPEAAALLREAVALLDGGDARGRAETLDTLGFVERDLGELASATERHRQALADFRRLDLARQAVRATVNLAVALKDLGHLAEARGLLEPVLAEAEALAGQAHDLQTGHVRITLGMVMELLNDPATAEIHVREARDAYERAGDRENQALALHNLGRLLDEQGRHGEAARCFGESLTINREIGAAHGVSDDLGALASLMQLAGRPADARRLHEEALAIQRGAGYSRAAVNSLADLAVIARDEGEFGTAESHLREAESIAVQMGDSRNVYETRVLLAELDMLRERFPEARQGYARAVAALDDVRRSLADGDDALAYFTESRLDALDMMVRLSAFLDEHAAALEWADAARSQQMVRQLSGIALPEPAGVPPADLAAEAAARFRLREVEAVLQRGGAGRAELYQARTELRQELGALEDRLAGPAPEYVSLRRGDKLSWSDIRALSEERDAMRLVLVEYYVTEDAVLAFGVTAEAEEPAFARIDLARGQLHELAREVRPSLKEGYAEILSDERLARLAEPVLEWARPGDMVYLVPHDALHTLPLHALTAEGAPLIDRNPVALIPSASVLRFCQAKRKGRRESALVVADPEGRYPLVFAREQAAAITHTFARHELLSGAGARRATLMDKLADATTSPDILHFTAHGTFDGDDPMKSGIELSDGRLTAQDIMGLSLHVDLVTLAACETGLSERRPGDELIGLIRALLYAGAPSALVSLWRVDELSTTMLLGRFYAGLDGGLSKAHALREAQLWLRERTLSDALSHVSEARTRLSDDPVTTATLLLEEAELRLAAWDFATAAITYEEVLKLPGITGEQRHAARMGGLRAGVPQDDQPPDYTLRAFDDPFHWAPFVLVGDWR